MAKTTPVSQSAGRAATPSRWTTVRKPATGAAVHAGESTRDRLLDAAERLFADQGFADTSVRDLTREATCNLASVNYHFGGKENLYIEVFERMLKHIMHLRVQAISAVLESDSATIDQVFRAFAVAFLEPIRVNPERGECMMRLYSREMAQPLLPPGMFFHELVQPTITIMNQAYEQTFAGLSDNQKIWCLHALVGPLVNVLQSGRFFEQADQHGMGGPDFTAFSVDDAVDHVVLIATAAAVALAERNTK